MRSFKNKIIKKGKTIKALKHSVSDINRIADSIEGEGDKTQKALEIANQNSENINHKSQIIISRGDYDTLERIESGKLKNVASRTLSRKFGSEDDYIEAHVYNSNGQLLQTINDFEEYQAPSNIDTYGKVSNFTVNPVEVLTDLGYSSGQYKLILNIQKKQILNGFGKIFTIKEISPSRQELKASYTKSDKVKTQVEIFLGRIEDAVFYKDFVLNFGQNRNELGINIAINNHHPEILIKLFEPLDSDLSTGDTFRIATEITDPISMDVDLGEPLPVDNTIQLQGPNYNIDTRLLNSVPSQYKTFDSSLEHSLTSSYQHLLQNLENNEVPNIQYDYIRKITDTSSLDVAYHFDNFVHFGSATERLKNFKYKLSLVELYDDQLANINSIPGNTATSLAVNENRNLVLDKKTNLIKGFDGYERFLYFDSGALAWPKTNTVSPYTLYHSTSSQAKDWLGSDVDASSYYGGQLLSASLFDRQNPHTLLNIIPKHIADNPDNSQYFLFSNMVGQHFDQIWSHIHHITKQKDTHHTNGISKNMVYLALKSLGIETFDQFENANLIEYILGEGSQGSPFYDSPVSQSLVTASNQGSLPKGDITKEVWKRLYHNAPYLLKTKGTERGIHALMNCYGLPSTILNIKEYGGPVADKSGYKTFSYDKYAHSFTGDSGTTGHFIKTNWSSSLNDNLFKQKTVEFRIKPEKTQDNYHLFSLSGSTNNTGTAFATHDNHLILESYTGNDISSSGDSNQYGRLSYYQANTLKKSTEYFPVFNGEFWNIFVSVNDINQNTSTTGSFGAYQTNWLKNTSYYTATMDDLASPKKTWGYGAEGAKEAFFGGLTPNTNAPNASIDGLRYSGSLQEIRYHFGEELTHDTLVKHSLEPFMYAGNTLSSSFSNVVFRLPLGSNNILNYHVSGNYSPNQTTNYFPSESFSSNMSSQIWKSNVEEHHLVTPDSVGASMSSEKIRLDGGVIDDDILSPIIKSETSTLDRQPQDFEDLGIFFSPQNEINEDIVYTLGGFKLDDYIGSPLKSEQEASSYKDLKTLSDKYFKKYKNNQRYSFWDYTKLIQYIDHTLFKIIEQHVPAKANLKTGLLIESHYLERNKFPIQTPTTEEFTTMLPDSHQTFYIGYDNLVQSTGFVGQVKALIPVSSLDGVILDEPQHGAQAPINPVQTTGIPFAYKPYQSSVLLGNALKGVPSSIYFRSLQLGKETDY